MKNACLTRNNWLTYLTYRKVVNSSLSLLVARFQIFWRLMKRKFDSYLLLPLAKKFQNWIVDRSTARDFTVYFSDITIQGLKILITLKFSEKWGDFGWFLYMLHHREYFILKTTTPFLILVFCMIRDLSRDDCIEEFIQRIWSSGLVWTVGLQSGLQWLKNSQMH